MGLTLKKLREAKKILKREDGKIKSIWLVTDINKTPIGLFCDIREAKNFADVYTNELYTLLQKKILKETVKINKKERQRQINSLIREVQIIEINKW